uniref:Uncharacterized protein n=1 Tax=Tanacetum cinerariifolium TaxID=118510 RepID=A0A6L2MVD3_TANCI|nr:hypothetical protein [Tanacetum cinerariifolium]
MEQPNPTFAKILFLDKGKFKQCKFRIQQYLQNEHYALWEVIEFGDSYKAPLEESGTGLASESSGKKKGRTVAITTKDMQKRRNDVKARTTLLNEATKKTKKNQLKQQYGNFKAEGSETLEQTFNRLQAIVSHLEFMDVEIERDDLNQKFLTSLASEWLIGKGEVNIASILNVSTQVSPASADVAVASISHDTIDEDDTEEIDIKWNTALLSMRANRFWKKTGKKLPYKVLMWLDLTSQRWSALIATRWVILLGSARHPGAKTGVAEKSTNKVEARLVEFKTQEIKLCEKIRGLEFDVKVKNNKIENLMNELEKEVRELIRTRRVLDTVLSPPAQVYSPHKKDMSWTGLPEFSDDTITDYSRPSPSVESNTSDIQNSNSSVSKHGESFDSIMSKPMIKFVKAADSPIVIKTNKAKTARKPPVRYTKMYRNTSKSPNVRGDSQNNIDDKGYWDSGCSRHMTRNISYLTDYEPYDGGYVSFGQGGGKITCKGVIKIGKLEFKNVYFVKDLKYNLFSVSQFCDNKNSVLFTESECIVLRRDFKLKDDTNVLLRTPRQHNMYSIYLNNIIPYKDLTCLVANAFADESMLWHRRLGKQHKASCKTKLVNSVFNPLYTLHMDLFGPTSISSLNHNWYCLVVTDDFSRFTWTFFLKTKDETSGILRNFINEIENLKELKVKIISNARTPQRNRVAKRRNKTLIEAARTMLADVKLPVTFWAEIVNTACYVQNRVLVNKSQNNTPYELFKSRTPAIGFLRPFGCHVMILNTLDHLGKFDAKGGEGYFVGYSMYSKAFRVFNKRNAEENLHIDFLENKLIEKGAGPNWLFEIDTLTNSMSYVPVVVTGTSSTNFLGTKDVASQDVKKDVSSLRYIDLPNWFHEAHLESSTSNAQDTCNAAAPESSGNFNPTATSKIPQTTSGSRLISKEVFSQEETPSLDNILTLSNRFEDILGDATHTVDTNEVEADLSNMESIIPASPTPTFRFYKDHPKSQIIGPVDTPVQTRHKSKEIEEHSFIATIHQKTTPDLLQFCLFSYFLSQEEPKKIFDALKDPFYVMQHSGFQDQEFPDRVYKVEKAMYGLHQASRAWYGTLSKYLLANGFQRVVQRIYVGNKMNKAFPLPVIEFPLPEEVPTSREESSH